MYAGAQTHATAIMDISATNKSVLMVHAIAVVVGGWGRGRRWSIVLNVKAPVWDNTKPGTSKHTST